MNRKQGVITHEAPPPAGPYSHAVTAGDFIFLAGQGPFDTSGNRVGNSFEDQTRQTLENLKTVAEACGASLADAVRVGVFVSDMSNFAELNAIYREYFSEPLPARTTVPVDLIGFDIEIDAVLYSPNKSTN
jgi:2-iminobutanoate/2-iminopropanoate deaminase